MKSSIILNSLLRGENNVILKVKMIPIVHAFLDDGGHLISVTGSSCLPLFQETVWPKLRFSATRSNLWWMQDGASPYCTNEVLKSLQDKFHGRVISRRTEHPGPAHSPDLNPMDFYFWSAAQKEVFAEKTGSINSLVQCIEGFAEDCSEETIKNVCKNVLKRARLCIQAGGGHFQQLMQRSSRQTSSHLMWLVCQNIEVSFITLKLDH